MYKQWQVLLEIHVEGIQPLLAKDSGDESPCVHSKSNESPRSCSVAYIRILLLIAFAFKVTSPAIPRIECYSVIRI
jgi:hypothetical protein